MLIPEKLDICLKRCDNLINLIEQERSGVSRFVEGDVRDAYCGLLDEEIRKLEELRRKMYI